MSTARVIASHPAKSGPGYKEHEFYGVESVRANDGGSLTVKTSTRAVTFAPGVWQIVTDSIEEED